MEKMELLSRRRGGRASGNPASGAGQRDAQRAAGSTGQDRAGQVADQLYAAFARGKELRRLVSIVGEGALSEEDRRYLAFAGDFEAGFVGQGHTSRTIEETLETAWRLLERFPPTELKRIKRETLERRGVVGSAGTSEA